MSDYKETFIDREIPAYHVSCRYCGVDLYGRGGEHKPECPRHARRPSLSVRYRAWLRLHHYWTGKWMFRQAWRDARRAEA